MGREAGGRVSREGGGVGESMGESVCGGRERVSVERASVGERVWERESVGERVRERESEFVRESECGRERVSVGERVSV